jgi:hypothetical protein
MKSVEKILSSAITAIKSGEHDTGRKALTEVSDNYLEELSKPAINARYKLLGWLCNVVEYSVDFTLNDTLIDEVIVLLDEDVLPVTYIEVSQIISTHQFFDNNEIGVCYKLISKLLANQRLLQFIKLMAFNDPSVFEKFRSWLKPIAKKLLSESNDRVTLAVLYFVYDDYISECNHAIKNFTLTPLNQEDFFSGISRWKDHAGVSLDELLYGIDPTILQFIEKIQEKGDLETTGFLGRLLTNRETSLRQLVGREVPCDARHKKLKGVGKPRVAICISGQLRGFNKAINSIIKFSEQNFEADIYVHTWKDIGSRAPYPISAADRVFAGNFLKVYCDIFNRGLMSWGSFCTRYPSLIEMISLSGVASQGSILGLSKAFKEVIIEDDKSKPFSALTNQEKMYYKIYSCFDLIKSKEYDLVFRLRPDREILEQNNVVDWWEIVHQSNKNASLFVDIGITLHAFKGVTVGDTLAFGGMKQMERYSSFWLKHLNATNSVDEYFYYNISPHTSLAYSLFEDGVSLQTSPIKLGPFLTPTIEALSIKNALMIDCKSDKNGIDVMLLEAVEKDLLGI